MPLNCDENRNKGNVVGIRKLCYQFALRHYGGPYAKLRGFTFSLISGSDVRNLRDTPNEQRRWFWADATKLLSDQKVEGVLLQGEDCGAERYFFIHAVDIPERDRILKSRGRSDLPDQIQVNIDTLNDCQKGTAKKTKKFAIAWFLAGREKTVQELKELFRHFR